MIDVLVVGGGPAGLAAAIQCALAGLEVTVAEPRAAPIDKACGEGVMPAGVARLAAIGVEPAGRPFRGIRYLDAGHQADARFRAGPGLGVRRTTLHAALSQRAAELAIPVLPVRVTGFEQRDGYVCAAGQQARYLVAADGLHSGIRRACGLDPAPGNGRRSGIRQTSGLAPAPGNGRLSGIRRTSGLDPAPGNGQRSGIRRASGPAPAFGPPARFGLRRHYRAAPWTDLVEVYWADGAEAYVTPVADDEVGVAVLGGRAAGGAADFDARLALFPGLCERLAGAAPAGAVRGAGPLRQDVRARRCDRVLLVGDASGYLDALTGEGISVALAQAQVLAQCLRAGRPGAYEHAWRRVSRKSRLLTVGLLWSRHQALLGPRIVPAAQRWPALFTAIVNQVGGA